MLDAGIETSVGSVGDRYDNAPAETINGLYKAEAIQRRGPWRSFEAVEFATFEWVNWYNHRGLMRPIGHIPPAEAEERFHATLEQSAMAAQLNPDGLRRTGVVQGEPRRRLLIALLRQFNPDMDYVQRSAGLYQRLFFSRPVGRKLDAKSV